LGSSTATERYDPAFPVVAVAAVRHTKIVVDGVDQPDEARRVPDMPWTFAR
jgi:hypothetical protein